MIETIDKVTGKGPTYVTIDIDGIDPAWAPGTGVQLANGNNSTIALKSSA